MLLQWFLRLLWSAWPAWADLCRLGRVDMRGHIYLCQLINLSSWILCLLIYPHYLYFSVLTSWWWCSSLPTAASVRLCLTPELRSDTKTHQMWEIKTHRLFTAGYKQWKPLRLFNPFNIINPFHKLILTRVLKLIEQQLNGADIENCFESATCLSFIMFNGVMCQWYWGGKRAEEDTSLLIAWWANPPVSSPH